MPPLRPHEKAQAMMGKTRFKAWWPPGAMLRRMRGKALPALVATGAFFGVAGGIGFDSVLGQTSTTEFCLSCHEMNTLQEELSRTVHFKNRSGVRVGCGDCHVPRHQPAKIIAKFAALDDLYAHFMGTIDTPEKFEARRLEMAEKVWASMRADGSATCRTCHSFEAMALEAQSARPRRKHNQAIESGETCIDCHKGVAHALPAEFLADDR
jgi:nitrate/TMAO reductase-like tetraheme cytochrome c subunit